LDRGNYPDLGVGLLMTIYQIRSTFARRAALVVTVLCLLVCLGPLHLIRAALAWVEDEFELDMRDVWDGPPQRKSAGTLCK
jgi:hypothetical protein